MTSELTPTAALLQQEGSRRPPTRMLLIAIAIAGAIVFGGAGFAIGRLTAPARTFQGFRAGGGLPGGGFGGGAGDGQGGGGFGGGFRGGGLEGTVQSLSGDTLTLKTANGSIVTVNLSGSTTYSREVTGQQSDISAGTTVRIGINFTPGSNPATGTVNATSVTVVTP
jgi:hypothetical protein